MQRTYFNKLHIGIFFIIASLIMGMIPSAPEEGMYPLSEIHKVDLVEAGLKIDPKEIYNPDGVSLIDGLVKLGGCTGSFVSNNGLILTNHHCAFGAINRASTSENNYLENGFLANSKEEEIPATGYTCRITESYLDVSETILEAVADVDDVVERSRIISQVIDEIEKEASNEEESIEARVSEMFIGQTYILFKYRIIKDVRLVYAPPRSIGEFGGETDNWIWPRHTGDFSFMRAYVAPDGSAAEYSEDNIPYTPKTFLEVNPNGVKENDFVFILGYPGRTFRHRPSQYVQYLEDIQMPFIAVLFEWMIEKYEDIGKDDSDLQLKYASTIKGLANTMKNYRGKLKGLKRLRLVNKKQLEEEQLQQFIESDEELNSKYRSLLADIDAAYDKYFDIAEPYLWLRMFNRFSTSYTLAGFILDYTEQIQIPNEERISRFKDENLDRTTGRVYYSLKKYNQDFEKDYLKYMLIYAMNISSKSEIKAVQNLVGEGNVDEILNNFITNNIMESRIFEEEYRDSLLEMTPENIDKLNDPLFHFTKEIKEQYELYYEEMERINGALNKLLAELIDVKRLWSKTTFIPDANGTLRLTYGYIKGYSPADAMYYSPLTTLDGVIDKSYLGGEYKIPEKLYKLYEQKDFGRFFDDDLGGVPVCILYNMDTTGGNSGSPVLNAYGEIIGLNFDRAYEATINDFAWDDAYSRSIGVDIRYVLWITQKVGGADYLLEEMGVEL